MRVVYEGRTATEHLQSGVVLTPGENDVPDDVAAGMLAAGLVKKAGPLVAPAVEPDGGFPVPRRRGKPEERSEERS